MSDVTRLGILLSGRGSNFLALAQACAAGEVPAEIALVLSNVAGAEGIDRARQMGLETAVIEHRGLKRAEHERRVLAAVDSAGCEWICLAGYMRLLSKAFIERYPERILNIHPSLLPSFPGLDVHKQVLDYGVRVSGCTVHLVDAGLDTGPVVEQRVVWVNSDDTPETLASRVLHEEHIAYKAALHRLLVEPWVVEGRRVCFR